MDGVDGVMMGLAMDWVNVWKVVQMGQMANVIEINDISLIALYANVMDMDIVIKLIQRLAILA